MMRARVDARVFQWRNIQHHPYRQTVRFYPHSIPTNTPTARAATSVTVIGFTPVSNIVIDCTGYRCTMIHYSPNVSFSHTVDNRSHHWSHLSTRFTRFCIPRTRLITVEVWRTVERELEWEERSGYVSGRRWEEKAEIYENELELSVITKYVGSVT